MKMTSEPTYVKPDIYSPPPSTSSFSNPKPKASIVSRVSSILSDYDFKLDDEGEGFVDINELFGWNKSDGQEVGVGDVKPEIDVAVEPVPEIQSSPPLKERFESEEFNYWGLKAFQTSYSSPASKMSDSGKRDTGGDENIDDRSNVDPLKQFFVEPAKPTKPVHGTKIKTMEKVKEVVKEVEKRKESEIGRDQRKPLDTKEKRYRDEPRSESLARPTTNPIQSRDSQQFRPPHHQRPTHRHRSRSRSRSRSPSRDRSREYDRRIDRPRSRSRSPSRSRRNSNSDSRDQRRRPSPPRREDTHRTHHREHSKDRHRSRSPKRPHRRDANPTKPTTKTTTPSYYFNAPTKSLRQRKLKLWRDLTSLPPHRDLELDCSVCETPTKLKMFRMNEIEKARPDLFTSLYEWSGGGEKVKTESSYRPVCKNCDSTSHVASEGAVGTNTNIATLNNPNSNNKKKCCKCGKMMTKEAYAKTQWKNTDEFRRCILCFRIEHGEWSGEEWYSDDEGSFEEFGGSEMEGVNGGASATTSSRVRRVLVKSWDDSDVEDEEEDEMRHFFE